jgi:hypothetical protein
MKKVIVASLAFFLIIRIKSDSYYNIKSVKSRKKNIIIKVQNFVLSQILEKHRLNMELDLQSLLGGGGGGARDGGKDNGR